MPELLNIPQIPITVRVDQPNGSVDPLREVRSRLGLNRADFARFVGLSERTVATWENGGELKEASVRTIVEIGRLTTKLREIFASADALGSWLKTANPAFAGSQPIQLVERGEIDDLWRMVYFLESGQPS